MKLLHIDSSILAGFSTSRILTKAIAAQWADQHPGTEVEYLDLAARQPAHFDQAAMSYRANKAEADLTDAERASKAETDALLQQFLRADVVVVGAPMYNFTIPTQLKAWIDRIAQPGHTFRYSAAGPEGLAKGKVVIVASTRGGAYSTSDMGQAMEHQESYLKTVFGFLGVTDVRIVRAEGLGMGDAARTAALSAAANDTQAAVAKVA
jgi:FMN-dependent NADH-azoreductase